MADEQEQITAPVSAPDDKVLDYTLRPRALVEFVGQQQIKENLEILMGAAKTRKEPIEHVLLYGNPGLGKCVTPNTLVFTEQGICPIGSLGNLTQKGFQENITSLYGMHDVQNTSHFYNNGESKTIRIKTHHGFELEGTPNHPIVVIESDGMKFKQLSELKSGDAVAIGRGQNYFGRQTDLPPFAFGEAHQIEGVTLEDYVTPMPAAALFISRPQIQRLYNGEEMSANAIATQLNVSGSTIYNLLRFYQIPTRAANEIHYKHVVIPQKMTPELARLCGYLIGDAYVGEMGEIAFSNEDKFVLDDYCRLWKQLFDQDLKISKWRSKCSAVRLKNKKIREFFVSIGIPYCTSPTKEIPQTILRAPMECVAEFLRGYFECDGHIRPNCRQMDIISASKKLIEQLQIILLNFGIVSRRYSDFSKKEGRSYERLYITGGDVDIFNQKIGFVSPRKNNGRIFSPKKNTNKDLVPFGKERLREFKTILVHLSHRLLTQYCDRTGRQKISTEAMNRCLDQTIETCNEITQKITQARDECSHHIFWDYITKIEQGYAQTVDVSIPATHTFFGNGFINHNTTLAHIIANEMRSSIRTTAGPTIERVGDLAAILTNLGDNDVLFIDEIHRLSKTVEEVLYSAMEEYALDLVVGKGPAARTLRLDLPRFTLIGATTRMSMLSAPLRDRFGATYHLNFYTQEDIEQILKRSARLLGIKCDFESLKEISARARRTPRVANRLLRRVRDFAQVKSKGEATKEITLEALSYLNVDPHGLDEIDRRLLTTIIEKFEGGPVGLNALAAATSEEQATIEDIYEPYLLQLGFLDRTPRGRVATTLAYQHLGIKKPGTIL